MKHSLIFKKLSPKNILKVLAILILVYWILLTLTNYSSEIHSVKKTQIMVDRNNNVSKKSEEFCKMIDLNLCVSDDPIQGEIDIVYTWVNGSDPEFILCM